MQKRNMDEIHIISSSSDKDMCFLLKHNIALVDQKV